MSNHVVIENPPSDAPGAPADETNEPELGSVEPPPTPG